MEHGLTSSGLTNLVWLLIAIMAVAVASKYIRIPYTIALVIVGLVIAISPVEVTIDLTPDLILFIFLPALLFESAYHLRFTEVRDNLRPIALLAVPGVLLTALCVAALLRFITDVSWETAFLFGAIMSATDPISVLAIFRQLGAPRRLSVILEGESLFNDGTSLVVFRIILGIVIANSVGGLAFAGQQFVIVVTGGLALGAIVGYVVSLLLSRVNDYLIETVMTIVVAYGTYLLAERAGVSSVIAVVVAALILGNFGHATAMSPTTRLVVASTWEFIGFIANSLVFLLIGLEVNIEKLGQFWAPTLLAIASVLLVRVIVVTSTSWLLGYIHRPLPYRWQGILVWGGLRGAVALAMALSLPFTLGTGEPFPDRDRLQVMTFGVILFSLLVQGLTMEPLARRLGLLQTSADSHDEFEIIGVRKAMAAVAIAELSRMAAAGQVAPDVATELHHAYSGQISSLDEAMQHLHLEADDLRREHIRSVRRRLLQLERTVINQRHHDGAISERATRDLLGEVDDHLRDLDKAQDVTLELETRAQIDTGASEPADKERSERAGVFSNQGEAVD